MKKLRMFGMFVCSLLVFSLLCPVYVAEVVGVDGFSVRDKLVSFLEDVLGLDMSRYSILVEGGSTSYEYGLEVEAYGMRLVDEKDGWISVGSIFYNGFIRSITVSPYNGSLHYAIEPPNGSVKQLKNVFERYVTFAQKFNIDTIDASLALDLFDRTPGSLPKSDLSSVIVSSDVLSLYASQKSFGFCSIVNGVDVPNKTLGITFTDDGFDFHDTFKLYSVYDANVFSKEEATSFAFGLAMEYADAFFAGSEVKPDWSNVRSDVGLLMIPGQQYNNELNNMFLEAGVGTSYSAKRDATTLYPFWSCTFRFSKSIGNIDGVQVGVWGDTGEVAYCYEAGHLGSMSYSSGGLSSSKSAGSYDDTLIGAVVLIVLLCVVSVVIVIKNKRHRP